jgi:hypothetical protein
MATFVSRPVTTRQASKRADDIFFTTMSLLMLAIVLIGFLSSYFLRGAVFAHLPSLLIHFHGAVFSSWIILFVVQSTLISAGNIRLHRKLGVLGAVLAALMVILGVLATFGTLRRGAVLPSFFTPASFLVENVLGILDFGIYVAIATWQRNNPPVHKRLLLMANAMLMAPALSRMTFPVMVRYPFLNGVIPIALVASIFVFDVLTRRRLLAVTVIGGVLFVAFPPFAGFLSKTQPAQRVTFWAQRHP